MQAVEWADRNGANIISSSLGYGKDRYYTKDMDGKSYVAKAANLAARKGMLVVNSAGNEADDKTWQYIITPSDADSALCIGGITHSLTDYEHISFASFGPTADGRQKPNLCAFGHAWAASPKNDNAYEMVYGTSFSCPLVAGFAACAWQASKGKTNMEMFDLLQRSADLYPYCDYAFGYGVPQAGFFVGRDQSRSGEASFRFERVSPTSVKVRFLRPDTNVHVFYKDIEDDGRIIRYGKRTLDKVDTSLTLDFNGGRHLVVYCDGYMSDYRFGQPTDVENTSSWVVVHGTRRGHIYTTNSLLRTPRLDIPNENRSVWGGYVMLGVPVGLSDAELANSFWSPAWRFGARWRHRFSKAYSIGLALEYGMVNYRYNNLKVNELERGLYVDAAIGNADRVTRRRLNTGEWTAELFQRMRLVPLGMLHNGLHWDLGAYVTWMSGNDYMLDYSDDNDLVAGSRSLELHHLAPLDAYRWQWGVTTRFTYDFVGLYARCRLSDVTGNKVQLPRLEVGLQLQF